MNPPHIELPLSGVSIRTSSILDIRGVKFPSKLIFEDHVPGIVNRYSKKTYILRLVKRVFVDTNVIHLCTQSLSIVLLGGYQLLTSLQLVECQVHSVARVGLTKVDIIHLCTQSLSIFLMGGYQLLTSLQLVECLVHSVARVGLTKVSSR